MAALVGIRSLGSTAANPLRSCVGTQQGVAWRGRNSTYYRSGTEWRPAAAALLLPKVLASHWQTSLSRMKPSTTVKWSAPAIACNGAVLPWAFQAVSKSADWRANSVVSALPKAIQWVLQGRTENAGELRRMVRSSS